MTTAQGEQQGTGSIEENLPPWDLAGNMLRDGGGAGDDGGGGAGGDDNEPSPSSPDPDPRSANVTPRLRRAKGLPWEKEGIHRALIVGSLLGFSMVATLLTLYMSVTTRDTTVWKQASEQLPFLLTPFHTLLGLAVGYYFATADKKRKGRKKRSR